MPDPPWGSRDCMTIDEEVLWGEYGSAYRSAGLTDSKKSRSSGKLVTDRDHNAPKVKAVRM